jgi:hypothetical protein
LETIVEEIIAAVNNIIDVKITEKRKTENPIQNLSRVRVRGAIRNSFLRYFELRSISSSAIIANKMLKPMFTICPEIAIIKTHYRYFFVLSRIALFLLKVNKYSTPSYPLMSCPYRANIGVIIENRFFNKIETSL